MKYLPIFVSITALLALASCDSLDNPISNLFHHHHRGDERVYNPQTGQWEWPADKKRSGGVAATGTPAPHGSDTRYWDAQRNQWMEEPQQRAGDGVKPRPPTAATDTALAAPAPVAPPPAPRASRASGIYNTTTGKIEWQEGAYVPPAATPAPKKHWYWPF